jgi:pyruvate kinase
MKYIAVVNPSYDEDEISKLIRKGIAGVLFEISHQNYPVAIKLIQLVKQLGKKYHRPISIIQDTSNMEDPLDMEVGVKSGVHWIASDKHEHMKMARGLNKLAGLIFKGRNLPKGVKVDSIMADGFVDPDAQVLGMKSGGQIKHLAGEHANQHLLDTLLDIAHEARTHAIAVSDAGLAKALSFRRPKRKIILASEHPMHSPKAGIYWGVHSVLGGADALSISKNRDLLKKGQRLVDATDTKHVSIHLV